MPRCFSRPSHTLMLVTVLTAITPALVDAGVARGQTVRSPSPVISHVQNRFSAGQQSSPDTSLFLPAVAYDPGGLGSNSLAVADLNGDGKPDVVVANCEPYGFGTCGNNGNVVNGVVAVLMGNGDGTFLPPVTYDSGGAEAWSVAVADVNGDGKPDLVVSNCGVSGFTCGSLPFMGVVSILLGNGNGTFQPAVSYSSGGFSARAVKVADLNRDGNPDIVVANFFDTYYNSTNGLLGVLLGNGDGTFRNVVTYPTGEVGAFSVAVADLNGDHKLDLAVSNGACPNTADAQCAGVLLGNGDGTFQPVVTYKSGGGEATSIAVADVNGDHKPDLVVSNWCVFCANTVGVLLGNGDGTFQDPIRYGSGGYGAWSVAIADVDGDGKADLLVANQCTGSVNKCQNAQSVVGALLGNGDGTFQQVIPYFSGGVLAVSLVAADVNGDGKPDVVVANSGEQPNPMGSVGVLLNQAMQGGTFSSRTQVVTSGSPSFVGQPLTFTATVTSSHGAIPNGEMVTFYDGPAPIGTGTTSGGVATFTTSSLTVKKHTIKAVYAGDTTFKPSSGSVAQVVNKYSTTTTLISSINPAVYGNTITFTATVASAGPLATGYVKLTNLGRVQLIGGVGRITKARMRAGIHAITAEYAGDSNSTASASPVLEEVVNPVSTTTVLSSSADPSSSGQTVTFTAKVTSATGLDPYGTVTFTAGTTTLGTIAVSHTIASISTATLLVGSTTITSTYNGSAGFTGSAASLTQIVQP